MKKKRLGLKKMSSLLVLAMLVFAFTWTSVAAQTSTFDTKATVAFEEGYLEIVDPPSGQSGMDFTFGTHDLPVSAVIYNSTNGPHLLRVADAMESSGGWNVTVSMTNFENATGTNSFSGAITLEEPSNNTNPDLLKTDPLTIVSGAGATPVMRANADVGRGMFDTAWASENTTLSIAEAQALQLVITSYEAQLSWTVSVGP